MASINPYCLEVRVIIFPYFFIIFFVNYISNFCNQALKKKKIQHELHLRSKTMPWCFSHVTLVLHLPYLELIFCLVSLSEHN